MNIKTQYKDSLFYYIGDETRDITAAKKSQWMSVAVTWGYHSKSALSLFQPDYMIDHPQELLTLLATE